MEYYCPVCNKTVVQEICPTCSTPTEPIGDLGTHRAELRAVPDLAGVPAAASGTSLPAGAERSGSTDGTAARPVTEEPRHEGSRRASESSPAGSSVQDRPSRPAEASTAVIVQPGEKQLEELIEQGSEVFLICGIGGVGKTELLAAFRHLGYLARFTKVGGMVMPTAIHALNWHPVPMDKRKVLFVDASGERFRLLYPQMRPTGELPDSEIGFLRLVSKRLRGLVLLVELERLWGEQYRTAAPDNALQVEILAWVLELLRWLRYDGVVRDKAAIRFQDQVDVAVHSMTKRLKIPVQVLFSKADQIAGFPLPRRLQGSAWLRRAAGPARELHPVGEHPLLFAYHCLPELYDAVRTHADHFRFDFAHSLVTDRGSGVVEEEEPSCGVTLSLKWLLDSRWRWPAIPTRHWIALQQRLDPLLGRDRWQRLPEPAEVRA